MKIPSFVLLIFFSGINILNAQTYNILNFGAVGNGTTNNTAAIQATIDSCSLTGGTVLIPSGNFKTGTLILKTNVTINLQPGSTISGSTSVSDYPEITPAYVSYTNIDFPQRSLFYAEGMENIVITGSGTIDGSGLSFLNMGNNRPYGLRIISCRNVKIENVTMKNSGFWMQHYMNCDSITITGITVRNHSNSNNDGLGIDNSRNVLISDCDIDSFDDAIVLKATSLDYSENVIVQNCTLASFANVFKIGTETMGGFRNIKVTDCVFRKSTFFVSQDAETGFNLAMVDGGFVDSVFISNITMTGIQTPIFIRLGNQARAYTQGAPTPGVGTLKNISLENIQATATTNLTGSITGIPGHYAENISLKNISVHFPGGFDSVDASYLVPENETTRPRSTMFGDTIPAFGLYVRHVNNLFLENVCFTYDNADFREALILDDVINTPAADTFTSSSNTVCVDQATGISGISDSRFVIFPNPAKNFIQIFAPSSYLADAEFLLFDQTGKQILNTKFKNKTTVALSRNIVPGFYFYKLMNMGFMESGKLIIQ